jgi:Raf kinase inhibitor-like YbhB/YbcL family protein
MRLGSLVFVAWLTWACGCRPNAATDVMGGANMPEISLTSAAYGEGQAFPPRFTGEGPDVSPALSWGEPPAGTKEWALIEDDPDAPTSEPWVHWVMYKIPAETRSLPEGAGNAGAAGVQGVNSFGKTRYNGPMPPKGHGVHHYHLRLYALDQALTLKAGASKSAVLAAMKGHVLATGELAGIYERK